MLTIGIPTYNRPDLLMETIKSVLKNDLENIEILICDNGTNDLTKDVAFNELFQRHEIKYYINKKNLGMYPNYNECLKRSTQKYITILNDDDILSPNFCTEIKNILTQKPLELLITKSDEFGSNEFLYKTHFKLEILIRGFLLKDDKRLITRLQTKDMFLGNPARGCLGVVMKVDTARTLGGFNTTYNMSADWAFWVCFVQKYRCYYYDEVLSNYRWHDNETMKSGIAFSFLEDAVRIRSEILGKCENPKKIFLKVGELIQFRLQKKRYKYLFSERSPSFFSKTNILISRILLRLIIWMA